MKETTSDIRRAILEKALPHIVFDGWQMETVIKAAKDAGYEADMVRAVFPDGVADILSSFSALMDEQMLAALEDIVPEDLRVRERIQQAVMARFRCMNREREAEKLALRYWSRPDRKLRAGKLVWRTADKIWLWAGDQAKDYNHYTKRGLLSGVIIATTLVWLNDESPDLKVTERFLERRIANVLKIGSFVGRLKKGSG